jgi:hypothetical protein
VPVRLSTASQSQVGLPSVSPLEGQTLASNQSQVRLTMASQPHAGECDPSGASYRLHPVVSYSKVRMTTISQSLTNPLRASQSHRPDCPQLVNYGSDCLQQANHSSGCTISRPFFCNQSSMYEYKSDIPWSTI